MDWQDIHADMPDDKPFVVWIHERPALATLHGDLYDAWWVVVEGDGYSYYLPCGAFTQYLDVEKPKE